MPIKVYRNRKFGTTHENKIFDDLIEKLSLEWEESEELIIILGNFYCAGTEIDALVVKNDSISIVDFKDYGGEIIFSENSDWKADGVNIKGGNKTNPYLQVHYNKFELLNYLKEKNIFNKGNNVNLGHISGIILFHQQISFDKNTIPRKISSWFHVTDFSNISILLRQITSKNINLSNDEILKFPNLFDLKPYRKEKAKTEILNERLQEKDDLLNTFQETLDILTSIEFAKNELRYLPERHEQFIDMFYPKSKPEKQLNYSLNSYFKNFENNISLFIENQKQKIDVKTQQLKNLDSKNDYIFSKLADGEELNNILSSKIKANRVFIKLQKQLDRQAINNTINIELIEAVKSLFLESGIYDEFLFSVIRNEFQKRDKLINYLHGIYQVLNTWFSDDMILQHEFSATIDKETNERKPYIKEYKFARGISENWYNNLVKRFNYEPEIINHLEPYKENIQRINPTSKKLEPYERYKFISEVKIPTEIVDLFNNLRKELLNILSDSELQSILELLNLSWIGNTSIDICNITIVNLKTHLLFSVGRDIDFLKKASIFPNSFLYEPFYILALEEIGQWGWRDKTSNRDEYKKTYKLLPDNYVAEIDEIIGKWSFYKERYKKGVYPSSNYISIGDASKECQISVKSIYSFLDSLGKKYSNKQVFDFHGDGENIQVNYDYKLILKKFKRIQKTKISIDKNTPLKKVSDNQKNKIIGYVDIRQYIERRLEPYKNPEVAKQFGLKKTAGIILYGPPGCGKTYWANWIADYLKLPLEEIFRSHIGSSFVDGAMKELDKKLTEIEKKSPIAIFFDEFDSIGKARNSASSSGEENRKVVNTLLQRIPKLIEKNIVVLAATNFINDLDSAVIRPGRFDLHIPIFPPLPEERAEILLSNLLNDSGSAISDILLKNYATEKEYWEIYTEKMYLFSNSHVLDFCNEFREQLYIAFKNDEIILSDELIIGILNTVKTKIRTKDVELYIKFYQESNNLKESFKKRMDRLKYEIDKFSGENDNYERRPIGFR